MAERLTAPLFGSVERIEEKQKPTSHDEAQRTIQRPSRHASRERLRRCAGANRGEDGVGHA